MLMGAMGVIERSWVSLVVRMTRVVCQMRCEQAGQQVVGQMVDSECGLEASTGAPL
jgi:hypothetical protein